MAASPHGTWMTRTPDGVRVMWVSVAPTSWVIDDDNAAAVHDLARGWLREHGPDFIGEVWGRYVNIGVVVMTVSSHGITKAISRLTGGAEDLRRAIDGLGLVLEATRAGEPPTGRRAYAMPRVQQVPPPRRSVAGNAYAGNRGAVVRAGLSWGPVDAGLQHPGLEESLVVAGGFRSVDDGPNLPDAKGFRKID